MGKLFQDTMCHHSILMSTRCVQSEVDRFLGDYVRFDPTWRSLLSLLSRETEEDEGFLFHRVCRPTIRSTWFISHCRLNGSDDSISNLISRDHFHQVNFITIGQSVRRKKHLCYFQTFYASRKQSTGKFVERTNADEYWEKQDEIKLNEFFNTKVYCGSHAKKEKM